MALTLNLPTSLPDRFLIDVSKLVVFLKKAIPLLHLLLIRCCAKIFCCFIGFILHFFSQIQSIISPLWLSNLFAPLLAYFYTFVTTAPEAHLYFCLAYSHKVAALSYWKSNYSMHRLLPFWCCWWSLFITPLVLF